jgi:hypothetical protein
LRAFLTVLADTLTPNSAASFLAISADPTFGSASTKLLMKGMYVSVILEGLPVRGLSSLDFSTVALPTQRFA